MTIHIGLGQLEHLGCHVRAQIGSDPLAHRLGEIGAHELGYRPQGDHTNNDDRGQVETAPVIGGQDVVKQEADHQGHEGGRGPVGKIEQQRQAEKGPQIAPSVGQEARQQGAFHLSFHLSFHRSSSSIRLAARSEAPATPIFERSSSMSCLFRPRRADRSRTAWAS